MITDILTRITARLSQVKPTGVTCHINPAVFLGVETELLLGKKYTRKVPDDYPNDRAEALGYRRLLDPADAEYQNIRLRIGRTTLHIADRATKKNLEAIALINFSSIETKKIGQLGEHRSPIVSGSFLLENGVVSCLCGLSDVIHLVLSYYQQGKRGFGGLPYPETHPDVRYFLELTIKNARVLPDAVMMLKEFKALPDLVMLCVDAYKGR